MNVRDALLQTPVKQVIFKLAPHPNTQQSDHLRARQLTAHAARGEYSRHRTARRDHRRRGFRGLRSNARYGLQPAGADPPRWVRSRTTPVALENLLHYLVALLDHPAEQHRVLEAAGPEVLSYQEQFEHFMRVSGRRRWLIPIPFPTRWISVWFLNVITSVPQRLPKH